MKYPSPVILFLYVLVLLMFFVITSCGEESLTHSIEGVLQSQPSAVGSPPLELQKLLWGDLEAIIESENFNDSAYWVQRVAEIREKRAFYTKYIDAGGVVIIGNAYISDRYFYAAREIVFLMTAKFPEIRKHLSATYDERPETNLNGWRMVPRRNFAMVLYHVDQGINSLPEYKSTDPFAIGWCTLHRCVSNVQMYPKTDNISMRTFVHEFAHAMYWAILMIDPTFDAELKAVYEVVREDKNSYWGGRGSAALADPGEYWAYSVTRWFFRLTLPTRLGEYHHQRFREKDPRMYALLEEWFYFRYLGSIESTQWDEK